MATQTIDAADHELLVGGERISTGEWSEVQSPYDGAVVGRVPTADDELTERAIGIAHDAFERDDFPQHERAAVLERAAALVADREDELTVTIAAEAGKPLKTARVEAQRCVGTLAFSAVEARKLTGETVPMEASATGAGKLGVVLRVPYGVVGAISPFNFPLNLVAHKLGPALAGGNAVVLKPAGQTPISAIKLAEILAEAGVPDGWLNVVCGPGSVDRGEDHGRRPRRRDQLHRLGPGRLADPGRRPAQEGQPRARLERAADRQRRRRLGDGRRRGQAARLLARGTELHLGPAHPAASRRLRPLHRALRLERRVAPGRRPARRRHRRRPADLQRRPRPRQAVGRRGGRGGRGAADRRRADRRRPLPRADGAARPPDRRQGLVRGDLRAGRRAVGLLVVRRGDRARQRLSLRPSGRDLHPRRRERDRSRARGSSSAACSSTRCRRSAPTRCPTAASRTRATPARGPPTRSAS